MSKISFFGLESKYFSRNESSCWLDWKEANFYFYDKTGDKENAIFTTHTLRTVC